MCVKVDMTMSREKVIIMKRSIEIGLREAKPYLLMIGLQFGMAGNYIFGKDFLNRGMSRFVFIVYRNAMAAFFLAPFAFFLERYTYIFLNKERYIILKVKTFILFLS